VGLGGLHIDPTSLVAGLIAFVVAITLHEFMHAFVAYQLGDPTAARLGRITLNPVAHFDPFGFLFTILLVLGLAPIAWGKPVPVNPGNFRDPKRGMLLTAAAGPLSNVVQAAVFSTPLWLAPGAVEHWPPFARDLIGLLVSLNLLLAAFNLIPIPPLDGLKILTGILPDFWYPVLAPLERNGFTILILIIFLQFFIHIDLLGPVISPVYTLLTGLIVPAGFR
jgi:Zn-dependent protease